MKLTMSTEACERFLDEARVGVISVVAEADRAPLTVPIWYDYSPGGEVVVVTASERWLSYDTSLAGDPGDLIG